MRGRGEKWPEEEGEPDRWGPPVGERRDGEKLVGCWAAKRLGRSGGDGPGERERWPTLVCWDAKLNGPS
jgi:hypothetical protein